jgi:hypothetical protein
MAEKIFDENSVARLWQGSGEGTDPKGGFFE